MSVSATPTTHQQERLSGLCIRPARSCDFPRMARMANEIFQHERDIDYFNKHRRVKMGYEPEASAADKLLAAEADWRLADMRQNRLRPGRHFIVATYLKQPADYLTRRHGSQAREELLGWAEWQDPSNPAAYSDTISDSSDQSDANDGREKGRPSAAISDLESILESLTLVHAKQALLVLPNGLAAHLPHTLESFRRAATDLHDVWTLWSKHIIPNSLGPNGDTQGRNLGTQPLNPGPLPQHPLTPEPPPPSPTHSPPLPRPLHNPLGRLRRPPPPAMGHATGGRPRLGYTNAGVCGGRVDGRLVPRGQLPGDWSAGRVSRYTDSDGVEKYPGVTQAPARIGGGGD